MANFRPVLFISLLFLGYLLWVEWQKDYGPRPAQPSEAAQQASDLVPPPVSETPRVVDDSPGDLPTERSDETLPQATVTPAAEMTGQGPTVLVTTDVLEVMIDLIGGTVLQARLLDYPVTQDNPDNNVMLFTDEGERLFIAQSGLLSRQAAPNHTTVYESDRLDYTLREGAEEIRVPLTWRDESGISVTKTFIFQAGEYAIEVRHTLSNDSGQVWAGNRYEQLQKARELDQENGGFSNPGRYSFNGHPGCPVQ